MTDTTDETKIAALEENLLIIKKEVDGLQIQSAEANKPWYLQASIIIAIMAFMFSLGTTAVSYYRTGEQNVLNSRVQLQSLIKELSLFSDRATEIQNQYEKVPHQKAALLVSLNTRNAALAKQAQFTIERLENSIFGNRNVLSVEYMAVATALQNSGLVDGVDALATKAVEVAEDPISAISALRMKAGLAAMQADTLEMRKFMAIARSTLDGEVQTALPEPLKNITAVETELQWWELEYALRNCGALNEHAEMAQFFINKLFHGPHRHLYQERLKDQQKRRHTCS